MFQTNRFWLCFIAPKGLLCRAVKKIVFVRPSVSPYIRYEIGTDPRSGPLFGTFVKARWSLGVPKLTHFGLGGKMDAFQWFLNYSRLTYVSHVWTALRNSPWGATHALRVLSSIIETITTMMGTFKFNKFLWWRSHASLRSRQICVAVSSTTINCWITINDLHQFRAP